MNINLAKPTSVLFTTKHMELLLIVCDGIRQAEEGLLRTTGDIDSSDPGCIFWRVYHAEELVRLISPLPESVSPSGKKYCELDRDDPQNVYTRMLYGDANTIEDRARQLMNGAGYATNKSDEGTEQDSSVPFTLDHMILLLTAYDAVRDLDEKLYAITNAIDHANPETAIWKLRNIDELICQLSPIYKKLTPSGKAMSELDWNDPENVFTDVLDCYIDDIKERARILMDG